MIESLRRHQAKQAQATPTPPAVVTQAPSPKAPPAARSWSAPDPGCEYRHPVPAAPKPQQSVLNAKMVAKLAKIVSTAPR